MKKMFCLMLVAVLMVGVMPFQAFADDCAHTNHTKYNGGKNQAATCTEAGYECHKCDDCGAFISVPVAATGHSFADANCTTPKTCTVCGATEGEALGHSFADATCTAPKTCTVCGATEGEALGHSFADATCSAPKTCTVCGATEGETLSHSFADATCTDPKTCNVCGATEGEALGHTVNNGICVTCGKTVGTTTQEPARKSITWQTKDVEGGAVVKSGSFTPNGESAAAKDILYYHVFNKTTAWKDQYDLDDMKVWSSKQGKDVGYNGTIAEGDTVTFVLTPVTTSNEPEDEPEYESGDSDLEIWVNLHTANVETKTRLLVTYENLSEDTLVHEFISDHRDEIDEMLINYYGKDYEWSGHIYDGTNTNTSIKTTRTLGEGTAVYINAYTYQDLVYIYVHDSRSYSNDRVILFEGKQIGDNISRSEVVNVVNDYYNLSSLKMYSEDDWKKVVQGKSVDARTDLEVTEEPYHIDVLISGSARTGSSYTADSTNPKTGDTVFTPVIVMGASVTALAVLFFLNKKRAIV